ncbi:MAG: YicC family protein [Ignavibacteria bacterium]|nr:YicC family protein [Ignavibacteria bacterium]
MLISMTGYGKAEILEKGSKYFVEVRSVNSRYSEISLKCPKYIYSREYEIRDIVKQKISRGKVNLLITKDESDNSNHEVSLDTGGLKKQISIIKEIKKKIGSKEKVKLEHILLFSDYFIQDNEEAVDEEEFKMVCDLINKALDEMIDMKKREGSFLEKDILERITQIENETEAIIELGRSRVAEERRIFGEKLSAFLTDRSIIDDKRLEFEIMLLIEKMDITEECVRLNSHLEFFRDSVNSPENVGRRLNFLLQEMNREINTIASKASDANISQKVSLLKEELEKIREQIQNIE